jgi:hypothetical protein
MEPFKMIAIVIFFSWALETMVVVLSAETDIIAVFSQPAESLSILCVWVSGYLPSHTSSTSVSAP